MTTALYKLGMTLNSIMLRAAQITANDTARQNLSEQRVMLHIRHQVAKERAGSARLLASFFG